MSVMQIPGMSIGSIGTVSYSEEEYHDTENLGNTFKKSIITGFATGVIGPVAVATSAVALPSINIAQQVKLSDNEAKVVLCKHKHKHKHTWIPGSPGPRGLGDTWRPGIMSLSTATPDSVEDKLILAGVGIVAGTLISLIPGGQPLGVSIITVSVSYGAKGLLDQSQINRELNDRQNIGTDE